MFGSESPVMPAPEGANRSFFDRQALIAAQQAKSRQGV